MSKGQIENASETELKCRLFCTSTSSRTFEEIESGKTLAENNCILFTSACETWKTHPIEVFRQQLSSNIEKTTKVSKSAIKVSLFKMHHEFY
ncbi:unnamed protein product [Schistosoma turkestanicum]|nr:unnamed protein product [Schistosoma turkestanicum]